MGQEIGKTDLAELRRLHEAAMQETSTPQDLRRSMNAAYLALPALLDELEESREEIRRLTQANGDLRTERDRAVKEAQRQDGVAKGLRKERTALAAHDAALLRSLAAKLDGEGHPANEYYRNWLRAEADHIEQEAANGKTGS